MSSNSSLWVDKYEAKKYLDLLTDEPTNRKVITWLKSWDEVVFPEKDPIGLNVPEFTKLGYRVQDRE